MKKPQVVLKKYQAVLLPNGPAGSFIRAEIQFWARNIELAETIAQNRAEYLSMGNSIRVDSVTEMA